MQKIVVTKLVNAELAPKMLFPHPVGTLSTGEGVTFVIAPSQFGPKTHEILEFDRQKNRGIG